MSAEKVDEAWQKANAFQQALGDTAVATGRRLGAIHGPIWDARRDVAKTLLSLAAGVLVVTVTFGETPSQTARSVEAWLLLGSWTALCVSIITAILALWLGIRLNTLPANIHGQLPEMYRRFTEAQKEGRHPIRELQPLMEKAAEPLAPAERWVKRFVGASLALFIAAMLLLGAAGAVRFTGGESPANKSLNRTGVAASRLACR